MPADGADVLLITATRVESQAVIDVFERTTNRPARPLARGGRIYFDFGLISGARILMTQSEMGSASIGAAIQTAQKGIESFEPDAVIAVGIAFGVDATKQSIGDILVATQLHLYELQRVGGQILPPRRTAPRHLHARAELRLRRGVPSGGHRERCHAGQSRTTRRGQARRIAGIVTTRLFTGRNGVNSSRPTDLGSF